MKQLANRALAVLGLLLAGWVISYVTRPRKANQPANSGSLRRTAVFHL